MHTLRRQFLIRASLAGFALTPIAAALSACAGPKLPDGMVEIRWDRDTCVRCNMVISDRRFAAQAHGGPKGQNWKFDDIGCAAIWLKAQPWGEDPATRVWVTDSAGGETVAWLDARNARYIAGKTSPMGYNFAAMPAEAPGSVDFEEMRRQVLALGR